MACSWSQVVLELASSELYGFATIKTDQDDYAPGELVTMTGSGWQPGETVNLFLHEINNPDPHDDLTLTAVADASGRIVNSQFAPDEHDLGIRFYLTATGTNSNLQAQTTFTDALKINVKRDVPTSATLNIASAASVSVQFNIENKNTNPNATTAISGTYTLTAGGLTKTAGPSLTGTFTNVTASGPGVLAWTFQAPAGASSHTITLSASITSPTCDPTSPGAVCTSSDSYTVNVAGAANTQPTVTRDNASVTVNEGQTATNTGTWSDANAGDTVTLSASVGTIIKSGTNAAGTWSWSFATTDGPANSQTVTITANDGNGGVTTTTFPHTVNNVAPTAALGNNSPVNESSEATVSFTSPFDPSSTDTSAGFHYAFACDNGSLAGATYAGSGTSVSTNCTFNDNGTFSVRGRIIDKDGEFTEYTTQVTVNNVAPTITSSDLNLSATSINENDSVTLSGSFSDPGTQDTHTVTIEWGDGSANTTLNLGAGVLNFAAQSHQYRDDDPTGTLSDNYTIKVTVKDKDNDSGNASKNITVNNVAPTLSNVAVTSPVNENGTATLTGNITDPGTLDTFTLAVNWGDGSGPQTVSLAAGASSFSVNHTYLDDNPTATASDTNTISLTLTDDDTGSDTKSTSVTVNNVAPTLSNVAVTSPINENGTAMLTGNITDPGTLDTFNLTINWGDGSGPQTVSLAVGTLSFSVNHTYLDDNPTGTASDVYSIGLTLADDDTGSTTASASVTVNNVIPGITYLTATPTSINENQSVSLSGTFIDPGTLDTHSLSINWGDGTPLETIPLLLGVRGFSVSHQYLDDNPTGTPSDIYTITVKVLDDDLGISLPMTQTVTVANAVPVIVSINASPSLLALGSSTTVTLNFSDVGTKDSHSCKFAWDAVGAPDTVVSLSGSGNTSCFATQTYTVAGVYTVGVTVTDDDTSSATTKYEYVVVYDPSAGFVTGGGWIQSPAGAYLAGPTLTGKANFGFVSKYLKGSNVPTGETEFQLHFATFNFHSTSYQWLVVSGARAQYKGTGKINGAGNYGFLLTATDGQINGGGGVDKFRIKIWDIDNGGIVVYDNVVGTSDDIDAANPQAINGGSITIHAPKK